MSSRSERAAFEAAAKQGIERGLVVATMSLRPVVPAQPAPTAPVVADPSRPRAKHVGHRAGVMNKTETRMAQILEARLRGKEIAGWGFERITLKLDDEGATGGRGCRYTPDFFVLHLDGAIEFVEVKGAHVTKDGRLKFRWAAQQYPWFTWTWAQWIHGRFEQHTTERKSNGA